MKVPKGNAIYIGKKKYNPGDNVPKCHEDIAMQMTDKEYKKRKIAEAKKSESVKPVAEDEKGKSA